MGFSSFADYNTKVVGGGQTHSSSFRKTPGVVTTAGVWFDLSTVPGTPAANFYASSPLVAATIPGKEGIQYGQNQSPAQRYLKSVTMVATVSSCAYLFIDILLYYPFIDGDSTDEQFLDNTLTLPRYATGNGVQAYVVAQGAYTGGAQFFINYTNQDGVAGRISQFSTSNTVGISGHIINSSTVAGAQNWNIPLSQGDRGIRSVQSFTFLAANGGIFALVLCKDLGSMMTRETLVAAEKDFLLDTGLAMPEIFDGAYIAMLANSGFNLNAAPFYGTTQFVWG